MLIESGAKSIIMVIYHDRLYTDIMLHRIYHVHCASDAVTHVQKHYLLCILLHFRASILGYKIFRQYSCHILNVITVCSGISIGWLDYSGCAGGKTSIRNRL